MSAKISFMSQRTCGEACWHATEDVCHCSCGGKNHGCLRDQNGIKPTRTSKIDGFRYELKAIGGREVYAEADVINKAAGWKEVIGKYHYHWTETDKGAPARIKPANKEQIARWSELTQWRGLSSQELYFNTPYLLWVKI